MMNWIEDKPQPEAGPFRMDLDRGVVTAVSHAGSVSMYVDAPGVYYDGAGNIVSDQVARIAGFDVEHDQVNRRKMERLEKAKAKVEAIWQRERQAIRLADEPEPEPEPEQAPASNPTQHLTDDGWRKLTTE
jgi:hypothetical protein